MNIELARMSKKSTQTKLVPKLRFPEFRDAPEWEPKRLGNEGDFLSSLTGKAAKDFDTGDASFIPYMNVFSNTFTDINYLRDVDVKANESQNAVLRGDVFFTVSSETPEDAGMSSILLDEIDNCYLNSFCALFRFKKGNSPDLNFLGYLLRSKTPRDHLARGAQGATRYNISKVTFRDVPLLLPSSAEQRKIADCLSSLDDLITAHAQKLEALRNHKKGLLQQLFPREGETRPRLRFPKFRDSGVWETRKISSILAKKTEPATLDDCGIYQEIGVRSHGKGLFHKGPTTGKAIGTKRVFHVVPNALVINIVFAWEQALAVTTQNEVGFIASHRFPMFVPIANQCNVAFIQRLFLLPTGKELLKIASPGGAGRNRTLSQKEFENLDLLLPSTPEQQRIADCLASLDNQIVAQAKRLEDLRTHKRGLMQQLFPPLKDTKA